MQEVNQSKLTLAIQIIEGLQAALEMGSSIPLESKEFTIPLRLLNEVLDAETC